MAGPRWIVLSGHSSTSREAATTPSPKVENLLITLESKTLILLQVKKDSRPARKSSVDRTNLDANEQVDGLLVGRVLDRLGRCLL